MSVPNNEVFSMQDVADEIGVPLNWNTIMANANASGFDPTYNNDSYAPAVSMLRFRNYSHIIQSSIAIDTLYVNNRTSDEVYIYSLASIDPVATVAFRIYRQVINADGFGSTSISGNNIEVGDSIINTGFIRSSSTGPLSSDAYTITLRFVSVDVNGDPVTYPDIYNIDFSDKTIDVPAI